jgi:hypothetical protein
MSRTASRCRCVQGPAGWASAALPDAPAPPPPPPPALPLLLPPAGPRPPSAPRPPPCEVVAAVGAGARPAAPGGCLACLALCLPTLPPTSEGLLEGRTRGTTMRGRRAAVVGVRRDATPTAPTSSNFTPESTLGVHSRARTCAPHHPALPHIAPTMGSPLQRALRCARARQLGLRGGRGGWLLTSKPSKQLQECTHLPTEGTGLLTTDGSYGCRHPGHSLLPESFTRW